MNNNIVTAAKKFSSDHFADTHLDQEQFLSLIKNALKDFPVIEDKIVFLKEVIRLGGIFLKESQSLLSQLEESGIAQSETSI